MAITKDIFDDNDVQFELEEQDKAGRYISIYTCDCDVTRAMLTSDGRDIFKDTEDIIGEYCDNYEINFYTEYYPYTDEIALKASIMVYSLDLEVEKKIREIASQADRVEDMYIVLTDEEKTILKECAKEYLGETLEEFFEVDKETDLER